MTADFELWLALKIFNWTFGTDPNPPPPGQGHKSAGGYTEDMNADMNMKQHISVPDLLINIIKIPL